MNLVNYGLNMQKSKHSIPRGTKELSLQWLYLNIQIFTCHCNLNDNKIILQNIYKVHYDIYKVLQVIER